MDCNINAGVCVCLCSSFKVGCLEAQQDYPLVAAVRRNTEVDLEEDVEEDFREPILLPPSVPSLSRSRYHLAPRDKHKKQCHPKGDCHYISVVCWRSLEGLPAAWKQKKKHTDLSEQCPPTQTSPVGAEKQLLCLTVQPEANPRHCIQL